MRATGRPRGMLEFSPAPQPIQVPGLLSLSLSPSTTAGRPTGPTDRSRARRGLASRHRPAGLSQEGRSGQRASREAPSSGTKDARGAREPRAEGTLAPSGDFDPGRLPGPAVVVSHPPHPPRTQRPLRSRPLRLWVARSPQSPPPLSPAQEAGMAGTGLGASLTCSSLPPAAMTRRRGPMPRQPDLSTGARAPRARDGRTFGDLRAPAPDTPTSALAPPRLPKATPPI